MRKKTGTAQHSSWLKGTRLPCVSLTLSDYWQHYRSSISPCSESCHYFCPTVSPRLGSSKSPHVLCDRAPSEPAPYSCPKSSGISHPCGCDHWAAGKAGAWGEHEDMNPEESNLFTSTAHRTTCFLQFTVVYLILNPRISSMINVPSRTPILFLFLSNPSYFSREKSCNKPQTEPNLPQN